jgi:hypothetical protein
MFERFEVETASEPFEFFQPASGYAIEVEIN